MYATLFSVFLALFLVFNPFGTSDNPDASFVGVALVIIASFFALVQYLFLARAWGPLQKAERDFTPRLLQLFKEDRFFRFVNGWFLLFPLLSYVIAIDLLYYNSFNQKILLAVWFVFLGMTIDLLARFYKKILDYLNPFSVTDQFLVASKESIRRGDEGELCQWVDALSEVAIKAEQRSNTSLANHAMGQMASILENYFQSAKSNDKANYTLYYLLQRLEMVFHKGLELRLEPVCRFAINTAGKMVLSSAKYDMSLAIPPLHFLGEFTVEAQKNKMGDIGDYASCVLLEVGRKILSEIDITYLEIREMFFTLISELEEIAKESFRQNRDISMQVLNQPFGELKTLFQTEAMGKHQDTPLILQDIDRVMGEFDALGQVLRTVPPIPTPEEEEPTSS